MSVELAGTEAPAQTRKSSIFSGWRTTILGCATLGQLIPEPVCPGPATLFAPRGACVLPDGSVWVADSGHHRVLGWRAMPETHGAAADILLGQGEWTGEAPNGGHADSGAIGMNLPVGICAVGQGLAVADAWNHRVLIWSRSPEQSHAEPDVVLGQQDLQHREMNRGLGNPMANSMYWPFSVFWDGSHLFVTDTGNRRVLIWEGLPTRNGQAADRVLGQADFTTRDEGAGDLPGPMGMRWPHSACTWNGRLCVADAGSSRIMVWEQALPESGSAARWFLGQRDAASTMHNGGAVNAGRAVLNMPYGITATGDWLLVADTANSRAMGWRFADLETGAAACDFFGQEGWSERGENRWDAAGLDTLCWPYGIHAGTDVVAIADTGNHRVLLMRRD